MDEWMVKNRQNIMKEKQKPEAIWNSSKVYFAVWFFCCLEFVSHFRGILVVVGTKSVDELHCVRFVILFHVKWFLKKPQKEEQTCYLHKCIYCLSRCLVFIHFTSLHVGGSLRLGKAFIDWTQSCQCMREFRI